MTDPTKTRPTNGITESTTSALLLSTTTETSSSTTTSDIINTLTSTLTSTIEATTTSTASTKRPHDDRTESITGIFVILIIMFLVVIVFGILYYFFRFWKNRSNYNRTVQRYRTEGNNVNLDFGSPNTSNSFPSTDYRGTSFKFNEPQSAEPAASSQPQSSAGPSFNYVPDKIAPKDGAFSSLDDKNVKAVDNKYFKFDDDFE